MISKEEFLKAIEVLRQQSQVDDNFQIHLEAAFPGSYAPIYDNRLWTLSINLLEQLIEDKAEYISWWVFETDFGKERPDVYWKSPDGKQEKEWNLTTAELLYDFLVENSLNTHKYEN